MSVNSGRTGTFVITGSNVRNSEIETYNGKVFRGSLRVELVDIKTGEEYVTFFNVEVTKKNTSVRLANNQFRITRNYALYDFWIMCGLPIPTRKAKGKMYDDLNAFGKRLKHLNGIEVTGQIDSKNPDRIVTTTMKPLRRNLDATRTQLGRNSDATFRRNHLEESQSPSDIEEDSTTCPDECVKKNKVNKKISYVKPLPSLEEVIEMQNKDNETSQQNNPWDTNKDLGIVK